MKDMQHTKQKNYRKGVTMFDFSVDRRTIYIILGILVVTSLLTAPHNLLATLFALPAVLVAITFHEYAHAWVADRLGDETPRMQGRLTLNPLAHLDPVGSILLVFAGFGWGKPVEIEPRNFNRDVSVQKGEALVSVAGPVMNFILAIVFALVLGAVYLFAPATFLETTVGYAIWLLLQECVLINIGLGVFNLLPLPPLDGSKIFINLFPYSARRWLIEHEMWFYYGFLIIWITGIASLVIAPIISLLYDGLMSGVIALLRLFL